jgi:multimeric flavodoxin WrbA
MKPSIDLISRLRGFQVLSAVALNCTLSSSPTQSSTELLTQQVLDQLAVHDVSGELIRVVDHDVRPGVSLDEGSGDGWPRIRERIVGADILLLATPIWLGQHSSICQRVLERLDAELSETNENGQPSLYGKVAIAAVVGNEDGAHHVSAILFQALNDVGFSIPAGGVTYWNGEAMHGVDYRDLDRTPDETAATTATLARNAAHLAGLLKGQAYPAE